MTARRAVGLASLLFMSGIKQNGFRFAICILYPYLNEHIDVH